MEVDYINSNNLPQWILNLDNEDINFIKNFILNSGSLKDIAKMYNVSYPTIRIRLDKIIDKINNSESKETNPYISLIKNLALNDKIEFDTAKLLIDEYKKVNNREV